MAAATGYGSEESLMPTGRSRLTRVSEVYIVYIHEHVWWGVHTGSYVQHRNGHSRRYDATSQLNFPYSAVSFSMFSILISGLQASSIYLQPCDIC